MASEPEGGPVSGTHQVTIHDACTADPQIACLSKSGAYGLPNQIQWEAINRDHTVDFPAGVFGTTPVSSPVPAHVGFGSPLKLLTTATPGRYSNYIDNGGCKGKGNPPTIIVNP